MGDQPNLSPTPPAAPPPAAPAGGAPAATPPTAPDPDGWINDHLERNPDLAMGIDKLMQASRTDPAILERFKGIFNPPAPAPAPAPSTPPAPSPTLPPDLNAAVLAALGGKEVVDSLIAAAARSKEEAAEKDMAATYTRLQAQAKAVAIKVHPTYYEGPIGEKIARLGVERSLRTGENLEAATTAEAQDFLKASGELGKKYVEALSPEGKRLVLTAGLQGGPPPNFDPTKQSNKEQVDAMTQMFQEEYLKAQMGG